MVVGSRMVVGVADSSKFGLMSFNAFALPRFKDGRLRPIVDRVVPFEKAADAYRAQVPAATPRFRTATAAMSRSLRRPDSTSSRACSAAIERASGHNGAT